MTDSNSSSSNSISPLPPPPPQSLTTTTTTQSFSSTRTHLLPPPPPSTKKIQPPTYQSITPPQPPVPTLPDNFPEYDDPYDDDEISEEMLEDLELRAAWGQLPSNARVLTQYSKKEGQETFTKVSEISETEGRTNVKANAEVLEDSRPNSEQQRLPEKTRVLSSAAQSISRLGNEQQEQQLVCLKCGKVGHTKRECKGTWATDSAADAICYRCGLNGHFSRDCMTDLKLFRVGMRCIYCGKYGHKRLNCPLLPKELMSIPEVKKVKLDVEDKKENVSVNKNDKEVITIDSSSEDSEDEGNNPNVVVINDDDDDYTDKNANTSKVNRVRHCYNCGQKGHSAEACKKPKMDTFESYIPAPNNRRNRDWFKKIKYEERFFGPRISVTESYGVSSFVESDGHDSYRGNNSNSSRSGTPQPSSYRESGGIPARVKTPSRSPPPFFDDSNRYDDNKLKRSTSTENRNSSSGNGRLGFGFKRRK